MCRRGIGLERIDPVFRLLEVGAEFLLELAVYYTGGVKIISFGILGANDLEIGLAVVNKGELSRLGR